VRREALAVEQLRAQRFRVMAPKFVERIVSRGVVADKHRSLFPGYVLVRFSVERDRWQAINNTRGVLRLISAGENPMPVNDAAMYDLHCRLRGGDVVDDMPAAMSGLYEMGQKVRITFGWFSGFNGIVDKVWDDEDRIDVMVSLFGRSFPVPMSYSMVEAVD
jgi:transcriptional antiterminator NusG